MIRPSARNGARRRISSGSTAATPSTVASTTSSPSASAIVPGRTSSATSSVSQMSPARGDGLRSHDGMDTGGA